MEPDDGVEDIFPAVVPVPSPDRSYIIFATAVRMPPSTSIAHLIAL